MARGAWPFMLRVRARLLKSEQDSAHRFSASNAAPPSHPAPAPQVHRALLRGATPVAVKLLSGPARGPCGGPTPNAASLMSELSIMARAPAHPNVVTCYGGCDRPPELFIVEVCVQAGGLQGCGHWRPMDCNCPHFMHGPLNP